MIINQVVSGGGQGGDVDALMETKYKISVKTDERSPSFAFESELYCQEQGITPIDYSAWESAGLDFWNWFLEANGFNYAYVTKWFRASSFHGSTGSASEEVCLLELELRDNDNAVVETIPGGYLSALGSYNPDASTGEHQLWFYVNDSEGSIRYLTYKSAPDDIESTIDFMLWDTSGDSGLAAPVLDPGR